MNNLDGDLPAVRVPDMERIRNARRKRQQQLKRWNQYDKTMEKKQKKGLTSASPPPGSNAGGRRFPGGARAVQFSQSVILLEAAARDDLDEGQFLIFISSFKCFFVGWIFAPPVGCTLKSIRCSAMHFQFVSM